MKRAWSWLRVGILLLSCGIATAQDVPIISGGAVMLATQNGESTALQPIITPVIAAPLGSHFLVESRFDFREFYFRPNADQSFSHQGFVSIDYLQLDYIANKHMTFTVGRFLTPFGIYNERFTAQWIRNLQDAPILYEFGESPLSGSAAGGMVRGVVYSNPKFELNYAGYYSAASSVNKFEAGRSAGMRAGIYLPRHRFEIGGSYQRRLQFEHLNTAGMHFAWQPTATPLELRSEFAYTRHAHGYWVEGAYKFSRLPEPTNWYGRIQMVARMQQFYRISPDIDALPGTDRQRVDFGLNYYLPHNVRFVSSYGRQFSPLGNGNIWNIGFTYRFLMPAWPGGSQ